VEDVSSSGYSPMIRDLPADLRPRERLAYAGPSALSTAELLAIILRVGNPGESVMHLAERLLTHFDGMGGLARATFDELMEVHGIGPAKAAQLQASLELGRRMLVSAPGARLQVQTPADVANLLMMEMGLMPSSDKDTTLCSVVRF